ncbi:MAG: HD domain-containing protein [Lachnospiraceae bacterium]|nr:HD domain-containing protein [Lachnospiraceae bacterium]
MEKQGERPVRNNALLRLFALYALFVLINISINRLMGALGLPLYLDNIGTLLAATLGGYLPGIVVGYCTNIINATVDSSNAYYAVISVLIAVAGTFMYRRGFFKSPLKTLLTVPIFAFLGGCLGSVLTYLLSGFGMGEGISAPFAAALLEQGKLNVFWAQMVSDVSIDLVDKLITVIPVFIILKLMPEHLKESFELTGWRQKPMSHEEVKHSRKSDTSGFSLRTKIIVIIGVIMVVIAVVTTTISFILYRSFAIEQYTTIGRNVASLAASAINPDRVNDYFEEGPEVKDYKDTLDQLYRIRNSSPYIEYIYVYQIRPDGCHVVFDLDTEELAGGVLGDLVPFDESFSDSIPDLLAGKNIEPMITDDTYGWLLTDYEPVYDSNGECVCYACTDINMQEVNHDRIRFLTKVTSLFIGFFIMILVLCMWLSDYHLVYPIDAMTFSAQKFVYDSEEALETGVERLKALDISTKDEIENLYEALSETIGKTVAYLDEVQKKGEEIAHMQNGLIYILADLVESRDKNTGDHVRKTAAYVRLILQILRENGQYPDVVTDDYIEDVCNSAPLHDVGKIKVSDVILNKPGKLTDEEFEIMKSHALAGKEVVESAMKLTTDPGYLKEALNLAAYHHEKWNGKGYPCGLKGEEIPLSARIMAVSDVFDALVSKRSYKKPFSFEDAMKIIEEGAGSHFDPVIAELFVKNADRVREIYNTHWNDSNI